jgi:hypothetical protein
MQIKKIHRVLKFKQAPLMKKYVELCSYNRKHAKTEFERSIWKVYVNANYGKSLETVRNRLNLTLIVCPNKLDKILAHPTVTGWRVFSENVVALVRKKPRVVLDKPIFMGFSILDLAKEHMYAFHYDYVKRKYGDKVKLLYTDTDSFIYELKTEDMYQDMYNNKELFDLSVLPRDHKNYDSSNHGVLGKMKDETKAVRILEFCGLRPKCYSLLLENKKEEKRSKGVNKQVVRSVLHHSDYTNTLFHEGSMIHSSLCIRSKDHDISTLRINKKSLSAFDDKRYLLNSIESLSYGHKRINKLE